MMKTYCLTFEAVGTITKVPDAQVIFGAICNIIKQTKGEEALENYLGSFNDNPLFVHSSMFPHGLLPMIKVGLLSIEERNKDLLTQKPADQLKYLSRMKEFKKIRYVSSAVFDKYFNTDDFDQGIVNLKNDIFANKVAFSDGVITEKHFTKVKESKELVTHVNTEEEDDRGLYYDMTTYYPENTRFDLYVKTDDIGYVKEIMKYAPYFGFGNRVSIGKNSFRLVEIKKLNVSMKDRDYAILMSKCISDEFDFDRSSYMIDNQIYKGSKYYQSNAIGRLSKIIEGSRMKVNEVKDYYGCLIELNNGAPIYHYGIGFVF